MACGKKPETLVFHGKMMLITEQDNMWSLFKDKNEINEKNVVGFASFVVMVLFAIADLATSFIFVDGELVINEVIYNSFVWVTLGCFGISSFEKVKSK
jgi:hypothetical protein